MSLVLQAAPPHRPLSEEPRSAAMIEQVMHGYVLLDDAIVELADGGIVSAIALLISERIGLEPEIVARTLAARSDEPLMLVCRAAGLNINGFSAMLRLRRRNRSELGLTPSQALVDFLEMPLDRAQQGLKMMKACAQVAKLVRDALREALPEVE